MSFTLIRLSLSVPLGESVTDVLHINMLYVNLHACHLPCTPPPFNLDLHSPRFSVCFCDITLLLLFCVLFFSVTLSFSISHSPFGSCSCLYPVIAFSRTSELLVLSLSTYCKGSTCLQWQILKFSTLWVWSMCCERKQKTHVRKQMQCVCCLLLVMCFFYLLS